MAIRMDIGGGISLPRTRTIYRHRPSGYRPSGTRRSSRRSASGASLSGSAQPLSRLSADSLSMASLAPTGPGVSGYSNYMGGGGGTNSGLGSQSRSLSVARRTPTGSGGQARSAPRRTSLSRRTGSLPSAAGQSKAVRRQRAAGQARLASPAPSTLGAAYMNPDLPTGYTDYLYNQGTSAPTPGTPIPNQPTSPLPPNYDPESAYSNRSEEEQVDSLLTGGWVPEQPNYLDEETGQLEWFVNPELWNQALTLAQQGGMSAQEAYATLLVRQGDPYSGGQWNSYFDPDDPNAGEWGQMTGNGWWFNPYSDEWEFVPDMAHFPGQSTVSVEGGRSLQAPRTGGNLGPFGYMPMMEGGEWNPEEQRLDPLLFTASDEDLQAVRDEIIYYDEGGGYGGYGGYGYSEPEEVEVTWENVDYDVEGAPDWWQAKVPSELTDDAQYMFSLNSMIPYLSPEDQRAMAEMLYQFSPEYFPEYAPGKLDELGLPRTPTGTKKNFMRSWRGSDALQTVSDLAGYMGKSEKDFGPGVQFLRNVLQLNDEYGTGSGEYGSSGYRTRRDTEELYNAVASLSESSDVGGFGNLAQMFTNPNFSWGAMVPRYQNDYGETVYGTRNRRFT